MRNNLNADRVRRHAARSTPDRVMLYIDVLDDNFEYKYNVWLRAFKKKMVIKYPETDLRIEIYEDKILAYDFCKKVFAVRVRPPKGAKPSTKESRYLSA